MITIIGIDPGLDGAVAILNSDGGVCAIHDTPTLNVEGKSGCRREYEVSLMAALLRFAGAVAFIENVHAMPGQGVRSMFSMGYGLGVWEGILAGLGIPYERVTPQRWKKAMMDGMGHDKNSSRLQAMRLFPSVADQLKYKKDEGRAEALLIAEFGRRSRLGVSVGGPT